MDTLIRDGDRLNGSSCVNLGPNILQPLEHLVVWTGVRLEQLIPGTFSQQFTNMMAATKVEQGPLQEMLESDGGTAELSGV